MAELQNKILERMNETKSSPNEKGPIKTTPEDQTYQEIIREWPEEIAQKTQNVIYRLGDPRLVGPNGVSWMNVELGNHPIEQLEYNREDLFTAMVYNPNVKDYYYRIEGVAGATGEVVVVRAHTLERLEKVLDKVSSFDTQQSFHV
jgi:hypothetical protein